MQQILEAIQAGAGGDELANLPLPEHYRAAFVRREDADMFAGHRVRRQGPAQEPPRRRRRHARAGARRGVRRRDGQSSINFNTVWTSIFEPLPTFGFLDRLGKESEWAARHALPYHVVGSDASGVVLRVGSAVRNWKPGDRVTVHCNYVDDQDPSAHDDSMLAANQRIWGFETNFGGLADLTVVKANQLMPKPAHLTWEEAAVNALCNSTSYRMLVGQHGARMKQGDVVLIWGATGGIGGYAVQYVLNGGGTPVGVVSSPDKVELLNELGVRGRHRPQGRGLPVLVGRAHPGRDGVAALRQGHPRARRRGPRHRVRAPRPPDDGRVGLRLPSAAARSSRARRRRAT